MYGDYSIETNNSILLKLKLFESVNNLGQENNFNTVFVNLPDRMQIEEKHFQERVKNIILPENKIPDKEIINKIESKDIKISELVDSFLNKIKKENSKYNAYLFVDEEGSKKQAQELEAQNLSYNQLALLGIPYAVKDNILVKGSPATAGSKILENYNAVYQATSVDKLNSVGIPAFNHEELSNNFNLELYYFNEPQVSKIIDTTSTSLEFVNQNFREKKFCSKRHE